jgi:hypothetical protein
MTQTGQFRHRAGSGGPGASAEDGSLPRVAAGSGGVRS